MPLVINNPKYVDSDGTTLYHTSRNPSVYNFETTIGDVTGITKGTSNLALNLSNNFTDIGNPLGLIFKLFNKTSGVIKNNNGTASYLYCTYWNGTNAVVLEPLPEEQQVTFPCDFENIPSSPTDLQLGFVLATSGSYIDNKQFLRAIVKDASGIVLESILQPLNDKFATVNLNMAGIIDKYLSSKMVFEYFLDVSVFAINPSGEETNVLFSATTANQWCVNSVLQKTDPYLPMLVNYVPFTSSPASKLFLTNFNKPKIWKGYPWTILCINNNLNLTYKLYKNNVVVRTSNTNWAGYDLADFSLSKSVTDALTDGNYIVSCDTAELTDTSKFVKKTLVFVDEGICEENIMLRWLNQLGGKDQWLFTLNKFYTSKQDQRSDYVDANGDEVLNTVFVKNTMQIAAERISKEDAMAIMALNYSRYVQMWINNTWVVCNVLTENTIVTESREDLANIYITLKLADTLV
jgi:hypothetical protein